MKCRRKNSRNNDNLTITEKFIKKIWIISLQNAVFFLLALVIMILPSCANIPQQEAEKNTDIIETDTDVEKHTLKTNKVTLDANGGYCDETDFTVCPGDVHDLPTPYRKNMYFLGWWTKEMINGRLQYGTKFATSYWNLKDDITLYAVWFPCSPEKIFEFGRYEQDNNLENGPEPVSWFVINWSKDTYLLVTRDVIDCMQLYETPVPNSPGYHYEGSDLRRWLNGEFYNCAFTEGERSILIKKEISSGNFDYVFAPSEDDSLIKNIYAWGVESVTDYANAHWIRSKEIVMRWWLRDHLDIGGACLMTYDYCILSGLAHDYKEHNNGVRPAILVDSQAFLAYLQETQEEQ